MTQPGSKDHRRLAAEMGNGASDTRHLAALIRRCGGKRRNTAQLFGDNDETNRCRPTSSVFGDSGHEGDSHVLGFYPRKGKITLYLMDGTARYSDLLARLGEHTKCRVCLYIKRLSDVELPVLDQILRQSHEYIKSHDGQMRRV